ncbi:condensin complex protein MksE [Elizabethkingia meningoseptica]|uniref:condensin complex protein MksE n=1 Tax=Elizabethkingia meningoseptica TaxID=238 RepID=UPI000B35D602|nr:hypothetical protein [Elizabethkingia meningoseptica]
MNSYFKKKPKIFWVGLCFELKSGVHIQYHHPDQEAYFLFIRKYYSSLHDYYKDLFGIVLDKGGEDLNAFYYLSFEGNNRGAISQRYFLSEECILIGLFVCKVYNIDFNSVESSLTIFKKLMLDEYEEYKDDFYKLLAGTKTTIYTGDDDTELEKSIKIAFSEFKKLGWVYFKTDTQFVILPSFERLRMLYVKEIMNIQEIAVKRNQQ